MRAARTRPSGPLGRLLAPLGAVLVLLGLLSTSRAAPPSPPAAGPARAAPDGGTVLSAEDREVVANLELLEHLQELKHFDLLVELSKNDADGGQ